MQNLLKANYEIFECAQANETYLKFISSFEEDPYPLSKTPGLHRALSYFKESNVYIWQINNLHLKLIEWFEIIIENTEDVKNVEKIHLLYNKNGAYDRLSDITSEEPQADVESQHIKVRKKGKEKKTEGKKHK